jgi:hypothetical protein
LSRKGLLWFCFIVALPLLPLAVRAAGGMQEPSAAPAKPVRVTVDWKQTEGTITARHAGMNLYAAANPQNFDNPKYRANLEYMKPGLLRLHNAGKMGDSSKWEGLIDTQKRTWDYAKIEKMLASLTFAHKPDMLLNIPGWPDWMDTDKDGFLDKDQFDAYAALLADLVRFVNVEKKFGVRYWEVTNERDDRYFTAFRQNGGWGGLKDPAKPDRWDELADIYNRCARAMKTVDPKIQVGGPGAARPDLIQMHERFARATLPNLDFVSFHAYASGSKETPDAEVYGKAESFGKYLRSTAVMLKKISPNREIPLMLGEYNISWTWETRDPRMTNAKGMVFDALVLIETAKAGIFSTQAWNEKDGIYGKTGPNDERRPSVELFAAFQRTMLGPRVKTESDSPDIAAMAATDAAGRPQGLLLANRSEDAAEILLPLRAVRVRHITDAGLHTVPATKTVRLAPHSVCIVEYGQGNRNNANK